MLVNRCCNATCFSCAFKHDDILNTYNSNSATSIDFIFLFEGWCYGYTSVSWSLMLMGAILLKNVGGLLGVKPIYCSHQVDAEVAIYIYRFPILFLEMFWEQHWSRFALYLQMIYILYILKFVAGHGTVVQPVSIDIVSECKEAQHYSRTHQLGFIRAVSWSAQNAKSHWFHVRITPTVQHFNLRTF